MENVTVLKITLEELSVKFENPRNEENTNPKMELKKIITKKKKRN